MHTILLIISFSSGGFAQTDAVRHYFGRKNQRVDIVYYNGQIH